MKSLLVLIPFLIHICQGFSQCFDTNFAFEEGETVIYDAYYNWNFVWLKAGYIEFKVNPGVYSNRQIYHLDAYGRTNSSYDWVFKVRDHYQCYLDKETLKPRWFHRENYEGGYMVDNRYFYSQDDSIVYTFINNSDQPFRKDTLKTSGCSWDLLSVIYYSRNLDFSGLAPFDSVPISTIIESEIYDLYIRYHGKDTVLTKTGQKYRCIKFSVLLVEGTIFKGGEEMFVWVTDDDNRIPVLIEANILVGSVKAYLREMYGLRNKDTSLVN